MTQLARLARLGRLAWHAPLAFLLTRAVNGAVALLHAYAVIAVIGEREAGHFFVFWTAAWLVSVVMRLGSDAVMPRVVAEAARAGVPLPSLRGGLRWALLAGAVAAPVAMGGLGAPGLLAASATGLAVAALWAAVFVEGSLLRAHGRIGWSGVVVNVLWPVATAAGPLVLLATGGGWLGLALVTLALSVIVLAASTAITVRVLGPGPLRQLARGPAQRRLLDGDALGAAVLSGLMEVMVWLPVLLAAVFAGPAATAVVFAAARLAGPVSWGYQAVVAALSPRLAAALARGDIALTRYLLRRGATAGAILTAPLCVAGLLLAPALVELILGRPSAAGADVLRLLVAARLADAVSGPVGESLLVGRRAWLDAALLATGVLAGTAVAGVLHPSLGVVAIGIGAAGAFTLANGLRLAAVARLLAAGWRWEAPRLTRRGAGVAALVLAAALAGLARTGLGTDARIALGIAAAPLAVAGILLSARNRALLSPLAMVALLLVTHFFLRALSIAADGGAVALGLWNVGYRWSDLADATSLGVLGMLALAGGFAAAGHPERAAPHDGAPRPPLRRLVRGGWACLAAGTLLWGVLFQRLGGVRVLLDDPAALHLNQFGGFYGTFGVLLCVAVGLVATWLWLEHRERALVGLMAAAGGLSLAGSVALATRGPLIVSAVAIVALVLGRVRPSRRTLAIGATVAMVLFAANAGLRQVREYAQTRPVADAIAATARTNPLTLLSGDMVEFDHLVGLHSLVPDRLGWLDGASIADVPRAFLPRAVYPDKPRPVDFELGRALYGPSAAAGTPALLAGEMYWNFGALGSLAGMLAFGLALGGVWRAIARLGLLGEPFRVLLLGYSYLLMTRPLAFMVLLTAGALAALTLALASMGVFSWRVLAVRALATARALTRAQAAPR